MARNITRRDFAKTATAAAVAANRTDQENRRMELSTSDNSMMGITLAPRCGAANARRAGVGSSVEGYRRLAAS